MAKIPRPEGHHTITPAFSVSHAADVIDFMAGAFGGKVVDRYDGPEGSVAHAEVRIGDSVVMLGEPMGDMQSMPAMLSYYVEDGPAVDAAYKRRWNSAQSRSPNRKTSSMVTAARQSPTKAAIAGRSAQSSSSSPRTRSSAAWRKRKDKSGVPGTARAMLLARRDRAVISAR